MSNEAIVRLFVKACMFFFTVLFPRLDIQAGSFLIGWRGGRQCGGGILGTVGF